MAAGLRLSVTWASGGILLGGYWYLRNVLASGSPFFPLGIAVGTDVLSQEYPDVWKSSFVGNGRPEIWRLAAVALWKMTGPCHFVAVLALPATAVWAIVTGLRSSYRRGATGAGLEKLALVALTVGAGCVLAVTPFALEDVPESLNQLKWAWTPARYGLSFLCFSVLTFSLVLQDFVTFALRNAGTARSARKLLSLFPCAFLAGAAGAFLARAAVYQNERLIHLIVQTLFVDERQRSEGLVTFLLI